MKYGVHRLTWGKLFNPSDIRLFLEQAKQTGADSVEFRPPDETLLGDRNKAAEIRKIAKDLELELCFCFGYPEGVDMRSPDRFARKFAVEHLKRAIEAVHLMGGREIGGVLYSTWPPEYRRDMLTPQEKHERTQRSLSCIREAMPLAEELNVQVNLEVLNRFENYLFNTVAEGVSFVRQVESDHCTLVLDLFHMNMEEDDLCAAIRAAKGYIGKFHASEPNRRIPFHNTRIDWPAVAKALADAGYDGTIIMETLMCFDDEVSYNLRLWRDHMPDHSLQARIKAMRNGIQFLKEQFLGCS